MLLQTLDLLLCRIEDLLREEGVDAADNLPVASDVIVRDEALDEFKGCQFKAGNVRVVVPDTGLAVAAVLRNPSHVSQRTVAYGQSNA